MCSLLITQLNAHFLNNFIGLYKLWQSRKNTKDDESMRQPMCAQQLEIGYNRENCAIVHDFLKKEWENCKDEENKKVIKQLMDKFVYDSSWWKRWTNALNPFTNKTSPPKALIALYNYLHDEDFLKKIENEKIFLENQITVCHQVCDKLNGNSDEICESYYQQKENRERELDELITQVYGKNFEDYLNQEKKIKKLVLGGRLIVCVPLILYSIFKPRN